MQKPESVRHWDSYWKANQQQAAYDDFGHHREGLAKFWQAFFSLQLDQREHSKLLDLASGNGAVLDFAAANGLQDDKLGATALDYSLPAINDLSRRFPAVQGVVADAAYAPFPDKSFDLVCSQYGVEYAGETALRNAASLVADGGVLALVCHYKLGAMYAECEQNLNAVNAVLRSRVLPLFAALAEAGAGRLGSSIARTKSVKFKKADKKLAPAVEQLKQVINENGVDVAGGSVHRLYVDLAEMFKRLEAHDQKEIQRWVRSMTKSLQAYAGRMQAMCSAALDDQQLRLFEQDLLSTGFSIDLFEPFVIDDRSAAWLVTASKIKTI